MTTSNVIEDITFEGYPKNTPDEIIRQLKQQVYDLETRLERSRWKNKNQRAEIKRLNKAIIERNYLVLQWSAEVAVQRNANGETPKVPQKNPLSHCGSVNQENL